MEEVELKWYGPFRLENFFEREISEDTKGVCMFLDSEYCQTSWSHKAVL